MTKAPAIPLKNGFLHTELPAFVMSIINCTPDSFWIGSRFESGSVHTTNDLSKTVDYALEQFANGADIIDIGGESTRPGSGYVSASQEIDRIIPLIEEIRKHSKGVISVDTRKFDVFSEACKVGADILNDVSALEDDDRLVSFLAREKLPVILMHKRENPLTMQDNTVYTNVVEEIALYLSNRVCHAVYSGIDSTKIILDAGIGFAKDLLSNVALIKASSTIEKRVEELSGYKTYGVLMGLSRKTCIGQITGQGVKNRLVGSCTANVLAVQKGARIVRVHDTRAMVDSLQVLREIG